MSSIGTLLKSSTANAAWAHLYVNDLTLGTTGSSPLVYASIYLHNSGSQYPVPPDADNSPVGPTQLKHWSVLSDPNGFYDDAAGEFTIPTGFDGVYLICANMQITNTNDPGSKYAYIYLDDGSHAVFDSFPHFIEPAAVASTNISISHSAIVNIVAGTGVGLSVSNLIVGVTFNVQVDGTGEPAGATHYPTTLTLVKLR